MPENIELEPGSQEDPEKENTESGRKEAGTTKFEDLTPDQQEQYHDYMATQPEVSLTQERLESGLKILEYEAIIDACENSYPINELFSIENQEEAMASPDRKAVKEALVPILSKLQDLEKMSDISPEKLKELRAKYKRISQAVGIINAGKVDHTR